MNLLKYRYEIKCQRYKLNGISAEGLLIILLRKSKNIFGETLVPL